MGIKTAFGIVFEIEPSKEILHMSAVLLTVTSGNPTPIPAESDSPLLVETERTCLSNRIAGIASSVVHAITELWGKKQPAFERTPGLCYRPGDEDLTGFFCKLMPVHSQRENWYAVCPYVAEFWSCLSNAGFIYAGCQYKEPLIAIAGAASIASHAFPKNWLLYLDKTGAGLAGISLVRYYKTFIQKPWLFAPMAGVAGIFGADNYYFAQTLHYNWPHVLWHVSAACATCLVFQFSEGEKAF